MLWDLLSQVVSVVNNPTTNTGSSESLNKMNAVIKLNHKAIVFVPKVVEKEGFPCYYPDSEERIIGVFLPTVKDLKTHYPREEGYSIQTEGAY